jgi:hypothetical protein
LSSPEISSSTIIKTAPALEKAVTDNATLSFYKSSSSTINQTAPIVEKAATMMLHCRPVKLAAVQSSKLHVL